MSKKSKALKKPAMRKSEPYWDYHEVEDYIEKKYSIDFRGYTPKNGFTEAHLAEAKKYGQSKPYLDFWHYITENNEIHNGCYFYLNLLGDYKEGLAEGDGDWNGDDEYRPNWVREIQKMMYDEFKPEGGEMYCWVSW